MTDRPLRVAIWTAVSSKPQAADDKTSLAEQERRGREFAAANPRKPVMALRHRRASTNGRWSSSATLPDVLARQHRLQESRRVLGHPVHNPRLHTRRVRAAVPQQVG